jgi:hypothetical protein
MKHPLQEKENCRRIFASHIETQNYQTLKEEKKSGPSYYGEG